MTEESPILSPDPGPFADLPTWRAKVEEVLAGTPFDKRLVSRLAEGLSIQPLYTKADLPPGRDPSGFPGFSPLVRGASPLPMTEEALSAYEVDPIGRLAGDGHLPSTIEVSLSELAKKIAAGAHAPAILVSTAPFHDAGATADQELAIALSVGLAHLRALEAAGMEPSQASTRVVFRFQVGVDVFLEIAKLRAARRLWCSLLQECGVETPIMRIEAQTAWRTMTARDPWVNMLRATLGAFAASAGGACSVEIRPFDEALGASDDFARRIAENTGRILEEESHLQRVIDPGGGSFYVERLTEDLAQLAWTRFQGLEGEGGVVAALRSGSLQRQIEAAAAEGRERIARRQAPITGVSEFPNLQEEKLVRPPAPTVRGAERGRASPQREANASSSSGTSIEPLRRERLSEPFERLRDRSDAHLAATGRRPRLFLANLGPVSEHVSRASFAENLFASGGIETTGSEELDPSTAAAALRASDATVAVICGADTTYASQAAPVATALRDAGARRILLAGRPGAQEGAYRAAGVDAFIFVGVNVVDTVESILSSMGVAE